MVERSFDDFDAYAKDYRTIHTNNIKIAGVDSFYFAEMKVKMITEFESNSVIKVLDVGCGDGVTEVFINKYFPSWNICAIDISDKSIEQAKNKNVNGCEFQLYDGKNIPFNDNSFDVIFMAGVLHHIDFSLHNGLLQEVSRVLKMKGRFYLFEHNPFNPVTKHLVDTCIFDKDAKLLKIGYALQFLQENNFNVQNKKFIIFFPRKGVLSKFIFLEKYLQWLPLGGQYFIRSVKK